MKTTYHNLQQNTSLSGIFLVLFATLLLSIRSILVKLAYIENVAVMDLLYYRFLFTVPLLLGFAYYKEKSRIFSEIKNKQIARNCLFAGFFGYYLASLSDFYSLELINANINRIILYSFPIYILVFNAIINRSRPKFRDVYFFILVQVNLFFVLGGFDLTLTATNKNGIILAFMAAISYAIYIIINQQTGKKIGSILFTSYAVTFSFLFINIHFFTVFDWPATINISTKGFAIILIMAIFCTFLPLLLISEGIKQIGAQRFALLNSSGPIMTILFCYLILGETMTPFQILSAVAIIIILYYAEKSQKN